MVFYEINPGPGKEIGKRVWRRLGQLRNYYYINLGLTQVTQTWIKVNAFAIDNERHIS